MSLSFRTSWPWILAACVAMAPSVACGGKAAGAVRRGNESYASGDYEAAVEAYDEALAEKPGSAHVLYNRGVACYRLGRYEEAEGMFRRAVAGSADNELSARARYNTGNCLYRLAEALAETNLAASVETYRQSVAQYREALLLDPGMQQAAQNIELARRGMAPLLAELRKRAEEDADRKQPDQPDPQNPADDGGDRAEGIDEDAQAVLDEERKNRRQRSRDGAGQMPVDKDW